MQDTDLYSLERSTILFTVLDTIPEEYRCSIIADVLKRDILYGYLLYSFERGVIYRDHLIDLLRVLADDDRHGRFEMVVLIAACLVRDDDELLLLIKRRNSRSYNHPDILDHILNNNVRQLVDVCTNPDTEHLTIAILICLLIVGTSNDLIKELFTRMTREKLFCLVCITADRYHTKWDIEIEATVIRRNNLSEYDPQKMDIYAQQRFNYLLLTRDQV